MVNNHHLSALLKGLKRQLDTGENCDIVYKLGPARFPAHKAVLTALCRHIEWPPSRRRHKPGSRQSDCRVATSVDLKNLHQEFSDYGDRLQDDRLEDSFRDFLLFIYSGDIEVTECNCLMLRKCAHYFGCDLLIDIMSTHDWNGNESKKNKNEAKSGEIVNETCSSFFGAIDSGEVTGKYSPNFCKKWEKIEDEYLPPNSEKLYVCRLCEHKFSTVGQLKKHVRTDHPAVNSLRENKHKHKKIGNKNKDINRTLEKNRTSADEIQESENQLLDSGDHGNCNLDLEQPVSTSILNNLKPEYSASSGAAPVVSEQPEYSASSGAAPVVSEQPEYSASSGAAPVVSEQPEYSASSGAAPVLAAELYSCNLCEKKFRWKNSFVAHRNIHKSERRFLCPLCGFSTNHYNSMKSHDREHKGNYFFCSQVNCSFKTLRKQNLVDHSKTHTKEEEFRCQQCDKIFTQVKNLRRHLRIHEKPKMSCPHAESGCLFLAFRTDKMKIHLERVHAVPPVNAGVSQGREITETDGLGGSQLPLQEQGGGGSPLTLQEPGVCGNQLPLQEPGVGGCQSLLLEPGVSGSQLPLQEPGVQLLPQEPGVIMDISKFIGPPNVEVTTSFATYTQPCLASQYSTNNGN